MKNKPALFVAVCFSLSMHTGCAPAERPNKAQTPAMTQTEIDDIRAMVLRYQFDHNGSSHQKSVSAFCIKIDSADPADAFMQRFFDSTPPVVKGSNCGWNDSKTHIVDKRTGEQALIFISGKIIRIDSATVEVHGGYQEANESASGNTYTLKKSGDVWTVVSDQMNWIA